MKENYPSETSLDIFLDKSFLGRKDSVKNLMREDGLENIYVNGHYDWLTGVKMEGHNLYFLSSFLGGGGRRELLSAP